MADQTGETSQFQSEKDLSKIKTRVSASAPSAVPPLKRSSSASSSDSDDYYYDAVSDVDDFDDSLLLKMSDLQLNDESSVSNEAEAGSASYNNSSNCAPDSGGDGDCLGHAQASCPGCIGCDVERFRFPDYPQQAEQENLINLALEGEADDEIVELAKIVLLMDQETWFQ